MAVLVILPDAEIERISGLSAQGALLLISRSLADDLAGGDDAALRRAAYRYVVDDPDLTADVVTNTDHYFVAQLVTAERR